MTRTTTIPWPLRGLLTALVAGLLISASAHAESTASDRVAAFHAELKATMQAGPELGYRGRYDKLQPLIRETFDLPVIARVVLGQHWRELDDDQQQQFIDVFTRLTVATYAARFNSYDGETFAHLGSKALNSNRQVVKTEMQPADDEPVRFDYLLQQRDDRWHIVSVTAEGVNDLSLKRAEYTAIIEKDGFAALLATLQDKIDSLARGTEND
ncbi:phospholipid transport system substrate-binding protein [Methylohalomonas lacus]|uniref:Phospholipid transport system substrate-binding protein n=1 Tax=Methylohalomonas lacus TaxID=398773 RepID=A0AAE3HJF7_9GAMM|nr:ABC transporter substrate-binding protein [Methylohalomonas lacus]MCS3902328.1 phospholipid transport system substrate-binding protein [Methylohalomonas lacus]